MPEQPEKGPELTKLNEAELPDGSILKGLDLGPEEYRWFGEQIKLGKPLKERQEKIIMEYVLQGRRKHAVLEPYCAAFALQKLSQKKEAGTVLSSEEEKLLEALGRVEALREIATTLAQKVLIQPQEVRISVQGCINQMQHALHIGNFDAAIRRADEALRIYAKNPEILQQAAFCYGFRAKKAGSIEQRIEDMIRAIDLFEECLVHLRDQKREQDPLYRQVGQARLGALTFRDQLEKEKQKREQQ